MPNIIPNIIQRTPQGERGLDLYSRLLQDRIIMLTGEFHDTMSELIVAQLLFLASEDPGKDIYLYINSPGGSISSGMAIYDTMQYIKPDVVTICNGMAASMGQFILTAGAPGKRFALPNAEIMMHQPLGGFSGQATDIEIHAKRILKTKQRMIELIAQHSGQDIEKITRDVERDLFMDAEEAAEYGLIDKVISKMPSGN